MTLLRNFGKLVAKTLLYRNGTVHTIKKGPLVGCRYRVSESTGWAALWGKWEEEAQRLYPRLIGSGDIVFDLGANVGLHSLLFAKLSSPSGVVVAFEPFQRNILEIEELIRLNEITTLRIEPKAVSDTNGIVKFHVGKHDKQGSIAGIGCETGEDISVESVTLSDFIKSSGLKPNFIKIDIEGAEGLALHGLESAMAGCSPRFAIDLHTPEQDGLVGAFLLRHNYVAFRLLNGLENGMPRLSRIQNLERTWPAADGIWGTIFAVSSTDEPAIASLKSLVVD